MRRLLLATLCLLMLLAAGSAYADRTRLWQQARFEDFQKGTSRGVAITSGGRLELAPTFRAIYTSPSTYIWSTVSDEQGNVYAAAGSPARLYRLTAAGTASVVFDPPELQIQSLAMTAAGVIYAATSPDGKVYKLEPQAPPPPAPARGRGARPAAPPAEPQPQGELKAEADETAFTSSVFFDPKTKYIWDLALDAQGRLYVATGDRGEIYRVTPAGEGALFFKSDEAHIRVLELDPQGNLIAGSDGSGLIYRITPQGEAFVVYSAPKKEITALAIDKQGDIYAAGVGEKRPAPAAPPTGTVSPVMTAGPQITVGPQVVGPATQQAAPPPTITMPPTMPAPGFGASGGSEIYRIAAEGSPRRIWNSREDIVYALAFDSGGRLLAGTGNKGRIFSVADDGTFTDLLKASATQVTGFTVAPRGGLYVSTSNLGKLFLLQAQPETEGTFESDVFDARIFSRWGRAQVRGTGNFEFYARSGNVDNPDRNWSAWQKVELERDGRIDAPPARFIQWKAVLRPANHATQVDGVSLFYRPNNVAPQIDDITVLVGARFQMAPRPPAAETIPVTVGNPGSAPGGAQPPRVEGAIPALRDRNSIAVRWAVNDENDDELLYSLYYRGDGETRWKLLKDDISDRFYSFEAALLPDGGYVLKLAASDAPSNTSAEALSSERESGRFEVDNTPPRIEQLQAVRHGEGLRVTFRASDTFSALRRAEYSIDAGPWQLIEPVKKISDSLVEHYDFTVVPERRRLTAGDGAASEHVIVVRAYDRFDNMGAARVVVR